MTDTSTFINQGVQHAEKAIQFDKLACKSSNPEHYENAKNSYVRAIEYYYVALKYEHNNHTQKTLRDKIEAYMSRAETMKDWLTKYQAQQKDAAENAQNDPNASEGGGTAAPSKKKGDKEEDNADERLRKRLGTAVLTEKPNVKWEDVAGLEGAKEALREAVILPQMFPQMFTGKRRPWKGILLYGPPGTGKSYLAKAVATEADATFFSVSSSDLVSKWQGESEKLVKELFSMARQAGKAIIFIDEIDALVSSRNDNESESSRRIKTEFLVQMDGVGRSADGVLLLAATNIPWALDEAMLRRMERRIYIPLPDTRARATMFQLHLGSTPHELEHDDFMQLAEKSEGYSGSDIAILCRDAIMEPVRILQNAAFFKEVSVVENGQSKTKLTPCSPGDADGKEMNLMSVKAEQLLVPPVSRHDFNKALSSTKPSVGKDNIAKHTKFTNEKGQSGV